jgi:hypothetical protein
MHMGNIIVWYDTKLVIVQILNYILLQFQMIYKFFSFANTKTPWSILTILNEPTILDFYTNSAIYILTFIFEVLPIHRLRAATVIQNYFNNLVSSNHKKWGDGILQNSYFQINFSMLCNDGGAGVSQSTRRWIFK